MVQGNQHCPAGSSTWGKQLLRPPARLCWIKQHLYTIDIHVKLERKHAIPETVLLPMLHELPIPLIHGCTAPKDCKQWRSN